MLIELESFETIRQFDLRLERHFFSDEDFGLYFEDEISFIGEVRKIGEDGAAVKGKICGAARLECARCTKPMPFEMKLDVDADFLPSGLFVSGPNHELKDRDFAS
ncbi:MAG TPA: hypothetical protein VNK26_04295, partial [Pyrinomonadaceae bacterium]|nr:hypothetical protein [Pyrinomonadaceae bacterium]